VIARGQTLQYGGGEVGCAEVDGAQDRSQP